MRIRTARELGAVLRDQRRRLALSQIEVSRKAGVSRKWIVEIERGKARAELTLVLRVLEAVGLVLNVSPYGYILNSHRTVTIGNVTVRTLSVRDARTPDGNGERKRFFVTIQFVLALA